MRNKINNNNLSRTYSLTIKLIIVLNTTNKIVNYPNMEAIAWREIEQNIKKIIGKINYFFKIFTRGKTLLKFVN